MNWNRAVQATYFLLRVVVGLLFLQAGGMKLFGWFGGMPPGNQMTPLLWLAGIIEVFGGILIVLGLFTRAVAFIASGEMAAAYFIGHFPQSFWPIKNHGEAAVLLCFIFLFLWGNGAGPFSLDSWMRRRKAV